MDIGAAVNSGAEWLCHSPLIGGIMNNPLFTALLITVLVMVVLMSQIGRKTMPTVRKIRTAVYLYIVTTAVLIVHHYAATCAADKRASNEKIREVFRGIESAGNDILPLAQAGQASVGSSGGAMAAQTLTPAEPLSSFTVASPVRRDDAAPRAELGPLERAAGATPPESLVDKTSAQCIAASLS
jgi:hypothetical protein